MPFKVSEFQTIGRPLAAALLAALSARPGAALLVTPTVHLFTAGPAPISPLNLPADFTEATFVGYAAQVITLPLTGVVNLPQGDGLGVLATVNFLAGAVVSPGENILGYWVDDGATAVLYYAEIFSAPIPIVNVGDFIQIDVMWGLLNPESVL
jgi:hypothetical protein